ncbi:MAG: GIY-YIG nuclease family protein [Geitlerinemataceae cyanobacterium]
MSESPDRQLRLFEAKAQPYKTLRSPLSLEMTRAQFLAWQTDIAGFQRSLRGEAKPVQGSLFEPGASYSVGKPSEVPQDKPANPKAIDPEAIDPWNLAFQSMSFWRTPATTRGYPCLYFVVDRFVPLLLYVGESNNSERRWRGEHDCKRYLDRYYALNYNLGLEHGVAIAFWLHAPKGRKARQDLEQGLIQKWKPPFNRECWSRWGQPFGKD